MRYTMVVCTRKAYRSGFPVSCIITLLLVTRITLFLPAHDVPDPEKPETWSFQLMPSWLGERDTSLSNADRLEILRAKSSSFGEPFKSLFDWIPEDADIGDATIATWTPIPWDNKHGTLTIAGDAAHPVPPRMYHWLRFLSESDSHTDRGQGLNLGIKDAYEFVAAIKAVKGSGASLSDSISKYDEGVVSRGADEVPTSRTNALGLHNFKGVMQSALLTKGVTASAKVQ
jgi:2-polyprenyl-6-methoxyphenol hydroxylase-like FAD-dependent oxidoreductase